MSIDRSGTSKLPRRERGVSLIAVLVILIVIAVLGLGTARMALLSEKATRYDRDRQIAWEAAEAALTDAQFDISGPNTSGASRVSQFPGYSGVASLKGFSFVTGCGVTSSTRGMCLPNTTGKALAYTVDFSNTGSAAPSAAFGTFTGRTFQSSSGVQGIQPAQAPRYIIEVLADPHAQTSLNAPTMTPQWIYRITAVGYGPSTDTQVVLQMIYRKAG